MFVCFHGYLKGIKVSSMIVIDTYSKIYYSELYFDKLHAKIEDIEQEK